MLNIKYSIQNKTLLNIFTFVFVVGTAVLIKNQYDIVLSRYPNQDLFWNDFQLLNSYRWFKDSFYSLAPIEFLGAFIDFRLGFGQTILTSKTPNVFLDIGAWLYLIFDFENSIALRYVFYAAIGCYGFLKLCESNKNKLITWVILFVSLINLPIFYYEVGLLNQTSLLATPLIYFLSEKFIATGKGFAQYILLLLLCLGVSDLHFIFYVFCMVLFALSNIGFCRQKVIRTISLLLIASVVCVVNYAPMLENYIYGEVIASKGGWSFESMWITFGQYLFYLKNYLAANFIGPISVYIPFFVFLLLGHGVVLNFLNKKSNRNFIICIIFSTLIISSGFLLYAMPILKDLLPSLIRYHVSIIPLLFFIAASKTNSAEFSQKIILLVGSILAVIYGLVIDLPSALSTGFATIAFTAIIYLIKRLKYCIKNNFKVQFFLNIFLVVAVSFFYVYTDGFADSAFRLNHGYIISDTIRDQLTKLNQICIGEKISKSKSVQGVAFVSIDDDPSSLRARDDFQMFLIENPSAINARTHNQWRYSLGRFDVSEASRNGLVSLFNFSFPYQLQANVLQYSKKSHITHIISSRPLDLGLDLNLLGLCQSPFKGVANLKLPQPFNRDQYIYEIKNTYPFFMAISSSFIDLKKNYHGNEGFEIIEVPVNYYQNLTAYNITFNAKTFMTKSSNDSLQLSTTGGVIRIGSFGPLYFLSRVFLLVSLLASSFVVSYNAKVACKKY